MKINKHISEIINEEPNQRVLKSVNKKIEQAKKFKRRVLAWIAVHFVASIHHALIAIGFYLLWNYHSYYFLLSLDWSTNQHFLFWFTLWSAIEIGFYIRCIYLHQKFATRPRAPIFPAEQRKALFKVFLKEFNLKTVAPRWFIPNGSLFSSKNSEQVTQISNSNLTQYLSFLFFSSDYLDLSEADKLEIDSYAKEMCEYNKVTLVEESGPIKCMRLHLDPLTVRHRPFLLYCMISIFQQIGNWRLRQYGFKRFQSNNGTYTKYWVYLPPSTAEDSLSNKKSDQEPIFFVHGIGLGLVMYMKFIKELTTLDRNRPMILLEIPHVSNKFTRIIPNMDQTIEVVDEIYEKHNLTKCSWVAHSYGTIITSWIIKARPHHIGKLTLIDPVCFALWEPDLIANFLYHSPKTPLDVVTRYLFSKELFIATTLFRNFWWFQNLLLPEELPSNTAVLLSENDSIINSRTVYQYLLKCQSQLDLKSLTLHFIEGISHGEFLTSSDDKASLVIQRLNL
ncbi:alpha/beta-hydrolase [Conidiobolus coronatus NRRL 28638]|uniref:Alpha/beta-hydrolase n=1 Tax=Conidiobolus coronatus (strain ATCC 28846 / CBS 209.66 / NRRL 28638) TaxID=796925 RepID=A0A137PJA8_CONC2|nr:alpha/beta-hydrolase [Conidiobolus coronatus NRRL 28638]|eukprot:KXN75060.1 alpha/beta-hydrolase [Conidiobolus coronatus NRRL 28638]